MIGVESAPENQPRTARRELLLSLCQYAIVGLGKTVAAYACYAGLILIRFPHQAALILTFIAATTLGYLGHSRLVFKAGGRGAAAIYLATAVVIYLVNAGLLELIVHQGANPLTAQVLCQLITIPLGYLLVKATLRRFGQRLT